MKYSSFSGIVAWSGGEILLRQGQAADDDHPLVLERPDLFQGLAPVAELSTSNTPPQVERATRAPGETRNTRAPRNRTDSDQ